ncbi:hypothetical protein VF14_09780 [Nostoc linckia z18]|jgi:hypothetical protein|uniref:DUF4112 domain-containing protein n=3 Tax=Nostoc TaxID=1177 RepID=A0A9Q6EKR4_NOSLI|nr:MULTISPECIES: DUF4112 domain-containing protein [Nostoc]MBL1200833.1 DUF4112 domain-containing protein [Nostoc sp. GBBB01]MDZ8010798.1 DUF4112 domain-containing protein [Nostoc sp. ZfuVER08]PHK41735.1 hypothetical protein VF12_05535 [Nostoc linckia z15]PHK47122.1 hypothetical protein VF13_07055 [Nostoc linckia z16]MBD2615268.1 DUF4112 domain-containing protein [Nostoc punctiforme FACHB-252]
MPDSSFRSSMIEPDAKAPTLKRLRQISRVLDNAITIPGTKVGIGIDPIIGLLPIGGDFLGVMFSSYIILEAARLGVSRATLGRMVVNVIIDGLVGAIPIFGDFFDIAWTANNHNLKLLEEHLKFPSQQKSADKWFIIAVLIGLLLISIALVALPVILIRILWNALTGS